MMARREMTLTLMLAALLPEELGEARSVNQSTEDHERKPGPAAVQTLIQEPLAEMPNPQVTMITLTVAPGGVSAAHEHTGPVFAYLLEGEIENQVDPNPARRYKAGDFFYEPPMHVHRSLRNLSDTQAAKLLIFEVGEKGKPFTIRAE